MSETTVSFNQGNVASGASFWVEQLHLQALPPCPSQPDFLDSLVLGPPNAEALFGTPPTLFLTDFRFTDLIG